MKKLSTIFFCMLLIISSSITTSFASSNRDVQLSPSVGGTITWISSGSNKFIITPNEDYYFSHFTTTKDKKKIELEATYLDYIRIKVKGQKYYEYFPSKEESIYKYLTVAAYNEIVEQYVKINYGTTSYTVVDTYKAYTMDQDQGITVHFKEKKDPSLSIDKKITTNMDTSTINTLRSQTGSYDCTFKSSNTKVCTIDKSTGVISIKGEGVSTITTTVKATNETKEKVYTTTVYSYPISTQISSIKQNNGVVTLSWEKDKDASGYRIKYAQNSSLKNYETKTINSPKTLSTTFKNLKSNTKYYFVIQVYKKSCGTTLYSKVSSTKSIKTSK